MAEWFQNTEDLEAAGVNGALLEYIRQGMKEAVAYLKAGNDPIIPFALTWDNEGKGSIQSCFHMTYGEAKGLAFKYVKKYEDNYQLIASVGADI